MWFLRDPLRTYFIALTHDTLYIMQIVFWPLIVISLWVYGQLSSTPSASEQVPGQQVVALDFRCTSWMLQTSLDKTVSLLSLEFLTTITLPLDFSATIAIGCLDILVSSTNIMGDMAVVAQDSERLAMMSAICFLRTVFHITCAEPTLSVPNEIRRRFRKGFPGGPSFDGFPCRYTMCMILYLFRSPQGRASFRWRGDTPSARESIPLARVLALFAQFEDRNRRGQMRKSLYDLVLRSTILLLTQDPQPPASVIADCLLIHAIDLGCDVSNTDIMESDQRCVHIQQITFSLTISNQCTVGASVRFGSTNT
jgi:hypothetical protein